MPSLNLRKAFTDPMKAKKAEKRITEYVNGAIRGVAAPPLPFEVGKNYLIRTVTMIDVGKVKGIVGNFVVLENVSWIGDTGRFHECLTKTDVFVEVEPFKEEVYLNANSIVDATPWPYNLPNTPK